MQRNTIVVIGGGLAAAKAVEGAREQGFDGSIVLLAAESHLPYERPALSKAYLRGESGREQLAVHEDALLRGPRRRGPHGYRASWASTGPIRSCTRRPAIGSRTPACSSRPAPRRARSTYPAPTSAGIHLLRTVDDADRLRDALTRAQHVVVVGGGWIGAEVAASARQLGRDVTMVHRGASPLQAVLGAEVARTYRDLHTEHGVTLVADASVEAFRGDADRRGGRDRSRDAHRRGSGGGRGRRHAARRARHRVPGSPSPTVSPSTTTFARATTTSSRRVTSPPRSIPTTARGCASSTGPTH